jgi:two-component system OmpR family response regulator
MPIKILTVDDEDDVRRLIATKLTKEGFEVIQAADGEEGVAAAKRSKPDLVIMDVNMPKMDGLTAAGIIKKTLKPAPIVLMLTADGAEADVLKGLAEGAEDYIVKPFAPRDLISRVKVALLKAGKQPHPDA